MKSAFEDKIANIERKLLQSSFEKEGVPIQEKGKKGIHDKEPMDGNDGHVLYKDNVVELENQNDKENMGNKEDSGGDDGDDIPLIHKLRLIHGSSSTMKSPNSMIRNIKQKQRKPTTKGKLKLPPSTTVAEKVYKQIAFNFLIIINIHNDIINRNNLIPYRSQLGDGSSEE